MARSNANLNRCSRQDRNINRGLNGIPFWDAVVEFSGAWREVSALIGPLNKNDENKRRWGVWSGPLGSFDEVWPALREQVVGGNITLYARECGDPSAKGRKKITAEFLYDLNPDLSHEPDVRLVGPTGNYLYDLRFVKVRSGITGEKLPILPITAGEFLKSAPSDELKVFDKDTDEQRAKKIRAFEIMRYPGLTPHTEKYIRSKMKIYKIPEQCSLELKRRGELDNHASC